MVRTIIKDFRSRCWKGDNTCEFIIVHHTASSPKTTFQDILRFFRLSYLVSCHYVVGRMGEITQTVDEDDRAWHAGSSFWKGKSNLNNYSIGIEVLSDGKTFTDEQREAVRWLCKDIMKRNGIPAHRVLRHKDVAPKRKTDIGESFFNPYWGRNGWSDFQAALMKK